MHKKMVLNPCSAGRGVKISCLLVLLVFFYCGMNQSTKQKIVFSKQTARLYSQQAESIQAEEIYTEHYEKIKAFLLSRGQKVELVDEILQELYLKLMSIDDLSVIKNPAAYFVRMAHNLMIDGLRRQARDDQRITSKPIETQDITDKKPSPFDEVLSTQRWALCEQALAELPENHREVLLLSVRP